jgi:hypothetical protein
MTPAERLRAAADLIERTGAAATPGPWRIGRKVGRTLYCQGDPMFGDPLIGVLDEIDDAAWIALVGPDLAPALAAWMRGEAEVWDEGPEFGSLDALAVADLILRGAE